MLSVINRNWFCLSQILFAIIVNLTDAVTTNHNNISTTTTTIQSSENQQPPTDAFRIINGHDAKPHSAPFIVSLQRGINGKHGCGGSIITPQTILTAAHCLKTDNLTDIYAVAGLHDRTIEPTKYSQKIRVRQIKRHENYKLTKTSGPYDIALLFLEKPLRIQNGFIEEIKLPENSKWQLQSGTEAILFGWGRNNSNNLYRPYHLQTITTDLLTYDECRKLLPTNQRLHFTNICTGRQGQDSIACHGDSGSPLVQNIHDILHTTTSDVDGSTGGGGDKNYYVQVGIVSWGYRICGWNSKPSIYTNTGVHLNWIWKNVKQYENDLLV